METQTSTINVTASGYVPPANNESHQTTFAGSIQSQMLGDKIKSPKELAKIMSNVIPFDNRVVRFSSNRTNSSDESNDEFNKSTTLNLSTETQSEYSEINAVSSQSEPRDDDQELFENHHNDDRLSDGQNSTVNDRRMRRQIANCNERRRMQSINAGFQALRQFLPQRCGEKLSKAAILQQTADLIHQLKLEKERLIDGSEPQNLERPLCKKRRIDEKVKIVEKVVVEQPKKSIETAEAEYLRTTIEELRLALKHEQELHLLYKRKFTELKSSVLSNLNAAAASISDLSAHNESQINVSPMHRSHSVKSPIVKTAFRELPTSASATPMNSIVAEAAILYNNAVINAAVKQQQQQNGSFGGLLSGMPMTSDSRFINPVGSISLPTLQIQNPFSLPFNNALTCSTNGISSGPLTPHTSPGRTHLTAILEAIRHLENENGINFVNDGLATDVLVR